MNSWVRLYLYKNNSTGNISDTPELAKIDAQSQGCVTVSPVTRGQNTFYGYEGYFEQIQAKIAPIVHFTIDQYLLAGAIL